MSSRDLRNQSQPRPRSSANRVGRSFEAWENINQNARPSSQLNERRAKSSMRYQPASRDSSAQRMRSRDPSPRNFLNLHSARASSAGRMRSENLPKNTARGGQLRRDSPLRVRHDLSMATDKISQRIPSMQKAPSIQRVPSLHNAPSLHHAGSSVSQEEIQAEERLKKAENKISGLLQELDELRFFQELEDESTAKTPRTPQMNSRNMGIPINIRAASPAKGRLPPPPPSNRTSKSNGGGLETYQPLSPRKIARLDRNSLELECQTLVRKLQIVDQEKQSQAAMIEMYEISMQVHDSDKRKIRKLEEELKKVSMELKRQLQNIQKGKESLVKEYEERIQNNIRKLERIQEKADSFKVDLGVARTDAEKWKKDSEKCQRELKDRNENLSDLQLKYRTMEEQLNSLSEVNSGLVHKVEKKRSETATLKEDLANARKAIEDCKKARNKKYEEKISQLEQQLRVTNKENANVETQCLQIKEIVMKRDKALDEAKKIESENAALVAKLKSRISDLERQNTTRFEEGKRAAKIVENKRMQELVAARAKETKDYECRLKAMQEQLRHQSDRHHAEIEETQRRNEENLSSMREEVKEEIRRVEGDKVTQLDSELKTQKRNYEQMKADYSARIKEHQQKVREVAADFQQKNKACQSEMESMRELMEDLDRRAAQKDDEIKNLHQSLNAAKVKLDDDVRAVESKSKVKIRSVEQLLDDERRSFEKEKSSLQARIDSLEVRNASIERKSMEREKELVNQTNDLQGELAVAKSFVDEYEASKIQLQELKNALEETQCDLQSERNRNKEIESDLRMQIAKLEGELRSNESNFRRERARLHELEQRLEQVNLTQSNDEERTGSIVNRLKKKLEDETARLERERSSSNEKDSIIRQLREEVTTLESSISEIRRKAQGYALENDQKEHKIDDLIEKMDFLETERVRKERELATLRLDYQEMSELIEKNLHTNMEDGDASIEMKHGGRESRETLNLNKSEYSDLEIKMKIEIKNLKNKLQRCESERDSLMEQLANTKVDHGFVHEDTREKGSDAYRKDGHVRDVVQRYTQIIANLETKLEEESHIRGELEDKLSSARDELEEKQNQTQELVHRHTKKTLKLESDLRNVSMERDELQMRIDQREKDLEHRRTELRGAQGRQPDEFSAWNGVKNEQTGYDELAEATKFQLERKEKQLNELKRKIPELLAELDSRTRERDQYKASVVRIESELSKRKTEFDEIMERYMKQVSDLESRLKGQSENVSLTRNDYETSRLEADRKDKKIREMNHELDEKRARSTELEMEKIEMESKLHTLSRAKDGLRSKVTELTLRVERKEREIRDLTDRYKMHVMELESKLDQGSEARQNLRREVEKLKGDLSSAADVSVEALELREKIYSLQRDVDESRNMAREADKRAKDMVHRLEARLESTMKERDEIENTLQKLTHEKSEVINALEGVINEVQNREDEIESLTEILQRRDEELQHAKVIATKALQSAKDIQKRYKEKEQGRHSDMVEKMDELHDSIDVLSSKNDSLERKISMLDRDLHERNLECQRLKDQLRQVDGRSLRNLDHPAIGEPVSSSNSRDDGSTYTQTSLHSKTTNLAKSTSSSFLQANSEVTGEIFLDQENYDLEAESFSPSNSTKAFHQESDDFSTLQNQSSQDAGRTQSRTRSVCDSVASDSISRRKIEQNALRNYVRQRFANR